MTEKLLLVFLLSFIAVSYVAATNIAFPNVGFNRDECYDRTLRLLDHKSLSRDDEVIFRDAAGFLINHRDNLTVTTAGC